MTYVGTIRLNDFSFPDQPTPPASTSISPTKAVSKSTKLKPGTPLPPAYRLLINTGTKVNGTRVVRGGFEVIHESRDYVAVGMRCYPPPPNAAYALTSQAYPYAPKETASTGNILTPASTRSNSAAELDVKKTTGLQLSLLMNQDKELANRSQRIKHLDGTAQEDVDIAQMSLDDISQVTLEKGSYNSLSEIGSKVRFEHDPYAPRDMTTGENFANSINFERLEHDAWFSMTPGFSGLLYPAKEQRRDFIHYIDIDKPQFEHCKKCQRAHIPPGPPITLEDRDTCGSGLPEWFPADDYEKPWKTFKKMINDSVYLTELNQGYTHKPNPEAKDWDLHFHEYNKKWKAAGRRGGWWKCRDGDDAPDVERDCVLCHSEAEKAKPTEVKGVMSVAHRLKIISDFIDFHTKRVVEQDKAIVLARARAEGIPEYIGNMTLEEAQFRNPVLSRHASASTIHSMHNRSYSMDTTYSHVGLGSPVMRPPFSDYSLARDYSPMPERSPAQEPSPIGRGSSVRGCSSLLGQSPNRRGRK